jgi:hypothetical protein
MSLLLNNLNAKWQKMYNLIIKTYLLLINVYVTNTTCFGLFAPAIGVKLDGERILEPIGQFSF